MLFDLDDRKENGADCNDQNPVCYWSSTSPEHLLEGKAGGNQQPSQRVGDHADPDGRRSLDGSPCERRAVDVPDEEQMADFEHNKRVERHRMYEFGRITFSRSLGAL